MHSAIYFYCFYYLFTFLLGAIFKVMGEIPPEVLGRILLFNQIPDIWGEERRIRGFGGETMNESEQLEDVGVDGRKIQGFPKLVITN